jgi:hypothetical protein
MRLDDLLKGNDEVQRHLAAERAAGLVVSPLAREAIEREVLPQLEAGVSSTKDIDDLLRFAKNSVTNAFKTKTTSYSRLVSYKSIDQSDSQFLDDLLQVLDEWATSSHNLLAEDAAEGATEGDGEPPSIDVHIHVDSEGGVEVGAAPRVDPKQEPSSKKTLTWRTADDEDADDEDADDDEFDLNDVRF